MLPVNDEIYDRWVTEARNGVFMGVPVSEMEKEDLLAVIGYVAKASERDRRIAEGQAMVNQALLARR